MDAMLQERLDIKLQPGMARTDVTPEDFCDGGSLRHLRMQVQLWASYRAQHLARTVRGGFLQSSRVSLCHPFVWHLLASAAACTPRQPALATVAVRAHQVTT
jgi:hypothetical protein